MTSLDKLQIVDLAGLPGHAAAVASLGAGHPFTSILADDPTQRAALLQAVIDTVADLNTRFVQVGNPLRAPLTIERLFLQAVGPEAEIRLERDGAVLSRILAGPVADETRLIVVVQQAETLDPEAMDVLRDMAPHLASVRPCVQLIFCAPTSFAARLQATPAAEPMSAAIAPAAEPVADPTPPALLSVPPEEPAIVPFTSARPRARRIVPWETLIVLAGLAAAGVFVWQRDPDLLRRIGLKLPTSVEIAHQSQAAAEQPAPAPTRPGEAAAATISPTTAEQAPPAAHAGDDTSLLRQEFDRFLAERPDAARLTPAAKDELFQEFLARRQARATR